MLLTRQHLDFEATSGGNGYRRGVHPREPTGEPRFEQRRGEFGAETALTGRLLGNDDAGAGGEMAEESVLR